MHHASNVAYDLSAYEPRRRPAQEQSPRVKVISRRSPEEIARPKAIFQGALVTALLACILGLVLYSNAILTELSDQITDEMTTQQLLLSENNRLQAEIDGKMSLRSIEDMAKTQLGLSEMEPYQVTYVNRTGGDRIMRTEYSPRNASLLENITDSIGSFLEYLRINFNKN